MKYDVICVGMALVDSIIRGFCPEPVSASGYTARSASLNVGGEAVNEAIASSRLGLKAGILCALGEDAAGAMVRAAMKDCGVDTDMIVPSPQTPVTTMFVREDGTRRSITNEAHRFNFHPERYADCFGETKAVILGSLFRAPFDDAEIIREVVRSARESGNYIFADTKIPNFAAVRLNDLRDILPMIDYITPNEDEARFFTGRTEPEEMADVFLGLGVQNVIIKLGGQGCFMKNGQAGFRLPGCRIAAVDATGAGDNFLAGFASEILRGKSPSDALRFANACGAICTTAVGASSALKSREQVLAWMKEQDRLEEQPSCPDRIGRVRKYERLYDEAMARPDPEKLKLLEEYYTSGAWREDYEADERGEFPPGLKRGVLSQDALYDLLEERSGRE